MGWFHEQSDEALASAQVAASPHGAELSTDVVAAAAAYDAATDYEKHVAENGKLATHAKAKELLAALSSGRVDQTVATKGLDHLDTQKAKYQAQRLLNDVSAGDF